MLALAGCAHQPGGELSNRVVSPTVDYSLVAPTPSQMYEAAEDEAFITPRPYDTNRPPIYPEELLSSGLGPVQLSAKVVVDQTGAPVEIHFMEGRESHPLFQRAIEESVMLWGFTPLMRVKAAVSESLPFSLQYNFRFEQQDGVPMVERGREH